MHPLLRVIMIIMGVSIGLAAVFWSRPASKPTTPKLPPSPTSTQNMPQLSEETVVLVGAGDIASCDSEYDEATASLLDSIPGIVFTTGDNAYPNGSISDFNTCYGPSWGRHKDRTKPAPGNHDFHTRGGGGYFAYFGISAGDPERGYYSYNLGDWHVIVLNSNCPSLLGCNINSQQHQWLLADLAAHPRQCTLAYWHHPRFSSGRVHGNNASVQVLWQTLYDHGVEIVLNGHEHYYERFVPMNALGTADPTRGIRQFIIGTGGRSLYGIGTPLPTSEVRDNTSYGVLKLTLSRGQYTWEFIPIDGHPFRDTGNGQCH